MKTYEINITFENNEECKKWEAENIIDGKYNGEFVMMVMHECKSISSDEVTLTEIVTI